MNNLLAPIVLAIAVFFAMQVFSPNNNNNSPRPCIGVINQGCGK